MSENPELAQLGSSDAPVIPVPEDIQEQGFKEVARIWRKDKGAEGERIIAFLRGTYDDAWDWTGPLMTLSRTIANFYAPNLTRGDQDKLAYNFLVGAAALLAQKNPAIMAKNDKVPEPVQMGVPQTLAAPEPTQEILVPVEITSLPEAQHVLNVWVIPETPKCEDCPDCGIDHESKTWLGVNTGVLTEETVGNLLGMITVLHADIKAQDPTKKAIAQMNVETAYHSSLTQGMPRA